MAIYSMGQYKTGDSDYKSDFLTDMNERSCGYEMSSATVDENESNSDSFIDPIIKLDGTFAKEGIYFVKIPILKNASYDCTYDIKLLPKDNNNELGYQFLRRVTIPKGVSNSKGFSDVVILQYGDTIDDIAAGIPKYIGEESEENNYDPGNYVTNPKEGDIYFTASSSEDTNRKYYYYTGSEFKDVGTKWNDQSMALIWESGSESDEANYYTVSLIFKVADSGFDRIIIEKLRTVSDYNSTYELKGKTYYGIKTGIYENGIILSQVSNILDDKIGKSPLHKIGVWSHPNAVISINGEEIHIGYNGYYEFSCENIDKNIEHLGLIVENTATDKFLIDYEYIIQ